VIAIGTLLMIVSDVQALECYASMTPDSSAIFAGGRAARELNKMFRISNGSEDSLELPIGDGQPTWKCRAPHNYCATLHCKNLYGMLGLKKILYDFLFFLYGISSSSWDSTGISL
jgi:hypothetical protein